MRRLVPASISVVVATAAIFVSAQAAVGQGVKEKDAEWNDLQVPAAVRDLLQDRKFDQALAAIDTADQAADAPRDDLAYLRGRTLELLGKYDDAIAAYQAVERNFPDSIWARRARFGQGISLARKGDFRAAELIYREQAVRLLSNERKQEIADIYLEFARRYFRPADENEKPDYQKALEFFEQALEVGPKPEVRPEIELLAAQCRQNLGQHEEAAQLYRNFIDSYPAHPLVIEARYRLGDCRLAQGQPAEARRVWEDMLAAHPIDSAPTKAPSDSRFQLPDSSSPRERLIEANFNLSLTHGLPQPPSTEALNLGIASLNTFVTRFPEHRLASLAHLRIALSYGHVGRYEDAVTALKRYLDDPKYANRDETPVARNLLGRAYLLQKKFPEALAAWRDYLTKHPAHEAWSEVQRAIVDAEFLQGLEERKTKHYEQARKLWGEFLAKYPLDERSRQILFEFGAMHHEQKAWDAALTDWRRLVSKYPGTEEAGRAQLMIAATLEEHPDKLADALKEYRKLDWGSLAQVAQRRIQQLTGKSLQIVTERVFRSNETPRLKLTTRNIEQVTVRAYTVDLETYFRKMHLARGVEGLDVALIDPDKSFEFEIPKYAEFARLESEVEVALPAAGDEKSSPAGVLVVTVSSETLEATTLVIQSDLDVIVKSSRDEVFVFAENLLTGEPWPNARLLISNGSQVFAEAVTGADGVFQKDYKELRDAGDVRVFAIASGNVASNNIGLEGVGIAQGLADKGYIYTDRSAYRAGQVVHIRGVLRRVSADAYRIEAGKKYTVEVFDPRNRSIREEQLALSDFGTFHAHFALPAGSVQGDYRVLVHDDEDASFQGAFRVHEYQLEPVRLAVETDRKVYYRGEEIEGKITARFYYDAPLADREVTYQLQDGRSFTERTNQQGEVHFKLPTRDFSEAQPLSLVVTLPERNLRTIEQFFLATQGFSIQVESVRPVYLAGETFEVTLKTSDPEGKPLGADLKLHVLEQTVVDGRAGEKEIEQHSVKTDAKTGVGRATLRLESGGRFVLRAEGIDRFEHPVSGQHVVQVSDENDQTRLRILAERHTFKVGDTAQVKLHWREPPALALMTYQGARVLGYRLVRLQTGSNTLEVPMTAGLAPNFELSVAVMTAGGKTAGDLPLPLGEGTRKALVRRFHEASSPFSVERELNVRLQTKRKAGEGPIRPGDEVELTLTTTDPQGKPVSAELSLAMIEQSLLKAFPRQVGAINDFFRGQPRESAVRTTSSVTFDYRPRTQPINQRLLSEEERLEVAAAEAASVEGLHESLQAGEALHPAIIVQEEEPALGFGLLGVQDFERAQNGFFDDLLSQQVSAGGQVARTDPFGSNRAIELQLQHDENAAGRRAGGWGGHAGGGGIPESRAADGRMMKRNWAAYDQPSAPMGSADLNGNLTKRLADRLATDIDSSGLIAPNEANLNRYLLGRQRRELVTITDGVQSNFGVLALGDFDEKGLAAKLSASGAVLLPDIGQQETGYWNPVIVTDERGQTTLTLTVPERSTAWEFIAVGITSETLAGEVTSELTAKKDLFGELKLPLAFTDGDEAEILVSIHKDAVESGPIDLVLKTTLGDKSVEEKKTIPVNAKGIFETSFKTSIRRPTTDGRGDIFVTFELTVTAGDARDVVHQAVPVRPAGTPVYATASGSAESDITVWVEPPAGLPVSSPSLEILIGPTVERSLLDVLLGGAPRCQLESLAFASGLDVAVSDVLAAIAIQKLFEESRDAGTPQAQAIDGRVRSALSILIASQNEDGGWSWTTTAGASDRYASSRAVWALSLARRAGYPVTDDAFGKATTYLAGQVAATRDTDYESKSILLHALSVAGQGDFALANRLHRNRPALSSAALAHLALALVEMDRKPMARELFDLLNTRNLDDTGDRRSAAVSPLPWCHSPVEIRALYALALQQADPSSAKAKELIDWLMAHRTGNRWTPEKATGPAVLALAEWFGRTRFAGELYQLAVFVNNRQVDCLDVDPAAGTHTITVPADLLQPGKQRINFVLTGRGRFTYQCMLEGFVPSDKLQNTTQNWRVVRHYGPASLELDGQEIPRGFGILTGSYTGFRNSMTQLPVGKRGEVELYVHRDRLPPNDEDHLLEYLVVSEPLPSGVTVIEQSVHGGFERFEVGAGVITFYIGTRRYIETIHFEVHGYLPGVYHAGPTLVRNAYRLDQLAASPAKDLTVLPMGTVSDDQYRLTPQELHELGKRLYAKHDWRTAGVHLSELFKSWNLQPEIYKETAQMLLEIHLETGGPAEVVRYFEIIKEKWPELEIPFEKIIRVASAYHEIGEYERSFLVFRATVESSFARESGVAGFLEAQGEFIRSVDVMRRLLSEYPPEPYVAAAHYALAQRVYAKAPEAADDARLREQKINRVDLIRRAWEMLDGFLTLHPDDPAADQAAFSLANALLDLEFFKEAIARCQRYAERYPDSDFLDSYWYVIGYSQFALGDHQAALAMCRKVAESRRVDKRTGREQDSPNKNQAIYILGQVYHSLGQAAEAIREYTRVEELFADAKQAIAYFMRQEIKLPEVTTVRPGEDASVELSFRNVASCDTKVYRIDLMKFSLLNRDLAGITRINLAGIRPHFEVTTELGDGKDYRDRTKQIPLPLKEEGAYLVVCRGADLHASGLVLVTPLAVEVQEATDSGRVRTTVKDTARERYLPDVHVKVIGTRNDDFVAGETDLRGVFVADSIRGKTTVIAQAEGSRYAFFRGEAELGPEVPAINSPAPAQEPASADKPADGAEVDLLDNLRRGNGMIQQEQKQRLQNLYEQRNKGVKVQEAF